jgi:hypothetical protein
MNPFDVIDAIKSTKQYVIEEIGEKGYSPFMVNRGLSYFPDTLSFAQNMNINGGLDNKLQFDYLFYSIRKNSKRLKGGWGKKDKSEKINTIMEYYQCNRKRAIEISKIINNEQLSLIKKKLYKGE